jgi:hypothetical protein
MSKSMLANFIALSADTLANRTACQCAVRQCETSFEMGMQLSFLKLIAVTPQPLQCGTICHGQAQ